MIRVVIDTSALVSAVISPAGPNALILELITARKIRPYVSDELLAEYSKVFAYDRLRHLDLAVRKKLAYFVRPTSLRVRKHAIPHCTGGCIAPAWDNTAGGIF